MCAAAKRATGSIFSIERYALHDGDGIRTIVYFKGCPLRCLWCSNPEGQEPKSELAFFPDRCIGCLKCIDVCPQAANRFSTAGVEHDRSRCLNCGRCADVCCAEARNLWGRQMEVRGVLAEVSKDIAFYRNSGGGITLSGGEPTMQAVFARQLLQACQELGIHTAIESCGYAPWSTLRALLPYLDQLLYDIKHTDPIAHARLTGVSNHLILENAKRLAASGVPMVIRLPLIPGCNDTEENICRTAEFVMTLPGRPKIELLAYHAYGTPKYEVLGRNYPMPNVESAGQQQLERWRDVIRRYGLQCEIS